MVPKGEKLRALIDGGEHFVCGDAYSALTGRIVEHVGFPAAYMGGHATSAFHYAVPDNGVYSQVEQIEQASRIANVMDIPLIADADTLGETVADAYHFTRRYIQQGIAGIHVEDEINPKHSKFVNGLIAIEDQQARLDAARRAQKDSGQDFVIIARCDELYTSEMGGGGTGDMAEAIRRGHAYLEAGADVLFYPPRPDWVGDLVAEFGTKISTMGFSVPGTAFNMATGGWVVAAVNHMRMAREIMENGVPTTGRDAFGAFEEKYELIDHPLYDGLIEEWAKKTGREARSNHAP